MFVGLWKVFPLLILIAIGRRRGQVSEYMNKLLKQLKEVHCQCGNLQKIFLNKSRVNKD
jgi:hypothetical protein